MTQVTVTVNRTANITVSGQGPAGIGIPAGGTTGQALTKVDGTDYNTEWSDVSGGPGGGLTQEQVEDLLGNGFLIGGTGITLTYDDPGGTLTIDRDALAASDIVSGTFDNARISSASVTQHQGLLSIGWAQLTGVPTEFTPASHTHIIADTTGLQAALDAKLDAAGVSAYGATLIDDLDAATARTTLGLGTAATSAVGDFAAASHTHAATDVTSGVFIDARISESSVTQHQAALAILETQISDGTVLRRFTDTEELGAYTLDAAGTADARSKRLVFGGQVSSVSFSLQAADTGTLTVRIRNDAGTLTSEGTADISADNSAEDSTITWTTGSGSFSAGDRLEAEATSGFATATWATLIILGTRSS